MEVSLLQKISSEEASQRLLEEELRRETSAHDVTTATLDDTISKVRSRGASWVIWRQLPRVGVGVGVGVGVEGGVWCWALAKSVACGAQVDGISCSQFLPQHTDGD